MPVVVPPSLVKLFFAVGPTLHPPRSLPGVYVFDAVCVSLYRNTQKNAQLISMKFGRRV